MVWLFIFVTFFLQLSAIRLEVELNHSSIKELLPPGPERLRAGHSPSVPSWAISSLYYIKFSKLIFSKSSHGPILIFWNPFLFKFLWLKIKKLPKIIFFSWCIFLDHVTATESDLDNIDRSWCSLHQFQITLILIQSQHVLKSALVLTSANKDNHRQTV